MAFFNAPRLFATIALAAIVLPAAANAAESAPVPDAVTVSTNGMDLANPAAQALVKHRIVLAARKLCAAESTGAVLSSDAYDTCVASATADAKFQLESRIAAASTGAMVASINMK